LALPFDHIDHPDAPAAILGKEAREALGGSEGMAGPILVVPRPIISLVLERDGIKDAQSPKEALDEVRRLDVRLADLYAVFLDDVRGSQGIRRLKESLLQLWAVPPDQLVEFIENHPELGTPEAIMEVEADLEALPTNTSPDTFIEFLRLAVIARLGLVRSLEGGSDPEQAATVYVEHLSNLALDSNLAHEYEELIGQLGPDPRPELIPQLRRALVIARRDADQERLLSLELARLLLEELGPGRQDRVGEAIQLLERVRDLSREPDTLWADATGLLGVATGQYRRGDELNGWERMCSYLEEACSAPTRESDPDTWSLNQSNLGYALTQRPGGSTKDDLSRALTHLQLALEVRSPSRDRMDWAYTELNLGIVYRNRRQDGDYKRAAECNRSALRHLTPQLDARLWGSHLYNLALVLLDDDASSNIDEAERVVREALSESAEPILEGLLLGLLARITRFRSGREGLEVAISLRQQAVQLLEPTLDPEIYLDQASSLTDELREMGRWDEAAVQYERSWAAFEALYRLQHTSDGRARVVRRFPRLSRWAAYALARAGNLTRAAEIVESGRAMESSDSADREAAELSRLALVDRRLVDRYYQATADYREIVAARFDPGDLLNEQRVQRARSAAAALNQVMEEIQRVPGFQLFLRPMKVADIASASDGRPVIYLVSAPAGTFCITVTDGGNGPEIAGVDVRAVTGRLLVDLLMANFDTGQPGLLAAQVPGADANALSEALTRLKHLWPLAHAVVSELNRVGGDRAIVVPTGLLGYLPLHLLPIEQEGEALLHDTCQLRLTPSMAVYRACLQRMARPLTPRLVGVADTDPSSSLPGSRAELEAISVTFSGFGTTTTCTGPAATTSWLLNQIDTASHVHLACHGDSSISDPLGASLHLGGGTRLTVRDFIEGPAVVARLVVASACQSGHFALGVNPDDFVGLAVGFLEAGSACAIVSLWPVADDGTALLMTKFYELHLVDRNDPPEALHLAMTWLRQLTDADRADYLIAHPVLAEALRREGVGRPRGMAAQNGTYPYASPEYWAAFVSYGC
jgi:CHAT domain-containing protein/tetratricopeptide (TPR) repeat protein